MNELTQKRQFVRELANKLDTEGKKIDAKKIDAKELAEKLNAAGHKTGYGMPFVGGRGTYSLIRAVYHWLANDMDSQHEADLVASSFTKPDGSYAYEA